MKLCAPVHERQSSMQPSDFHSRTRPTLLIDCGLPFQSYPQVIKTSFRGKDFWSGKLSRLLSSASRSHIGACSKLRPLMLVLRFSLITAHCH